MKCQLTFEASGKAHGLYSELINLRKLGRLSIRRASTIEWNQEEQSWEVRNLQGVPLFKNPSRSACLEWEADNLSGPEEHMSV